ncbi:adenylyl cyclase-associated protein 1-like [Ctenocephalides felis]|uniref:adenylyl cyclase-associated protein 1-like n=1 Tax=Ctenocephalides felis TaxID=7515 RepID=UPI000E6E5A95|nr:adenylyl cyclase-associated protein 1-like [Ctenocephalides felis]
MSVARYEDIVAGPLAKFLSLSKSIGGDVAQQTVFVENAFKAQLAFITTASTASQPAPDVLQQLLQPTSQQILAAQEFREKHRSSNFVNHLAAISESIVALGWVCISPTPAVHVKEMHDAGRFYTDRVLKEKKGLTDKSSEDHREWVRTWLEVLEELRKYVKDIHTTGLVWGGKKGAAGPLPPPPPPPADVFSPLPDIDDGKDRSALFAEINQGEGITRSLKKVTSDMQTHKNPTLRQGPTPFVKANMSEKPSITKVAIKESEPVFKRDGKKWIIEHQKNNSTLKVQDVEMNNVVYMFKCENSTLVVNGKLNSIVMDSCKKCSLVFDSVVSSCEFVNCQSVKMQVLGTVPTISIDKTDGCQMFLGSQSADTVQIVSAKSSEMNVVLLDHVSDRDGDMVELPIPEQFITLISGKTLKTTPIENRG